MASRDLIRGEEGATTQQLPQVQSSTNSSNNEASTNLEHDGSGTSNKKGRGMTTGISVEKKRRKGQKLNVIIHPLRKRIVGDNCSDFKTEACVVIKQYAPLQFAKWMHIPAEIKKKMWLAMKQKFDLQEDVSTKQAVYAQLNRQYRSYRHRLHKYYLEHKYDDNVLELSPIGVSQSDWQNLIDYFESETFEKMSSRNKANRDKLKMAHVCGTKTIAQYCHEERNPITGEEPSRTNIWKKTRYREEKAEWVDQASRQAYEDIVNLQKVNEGDELPLTEDEAFIKVLGPERPTRLRGCGDGLKPPSKRGLQIQEELERENQEYKRQSEEDRKRLEALEKEKNELASRVDLLESQINERVQAQVQSQVQNLIKSELASLMEQFKQSSQAQSSEN